MAQGAAHQTLRLSYLPREAGEVEKWMAQWLEGSPPAVGRLRQTNHAQWAVTRIDTMSDGLDIRGLEERALNAWPARQSVLVGGWQLRISGGFTKRANSANAMAPALAFAAVRQAAEAVYARHDLPPIFRLSPLAGPDADRQLDDAGYAAFDHSVVLTAPLAEPAMQADVVMTTTPTRAWLDGIAKANGVSAAHRSIHDEMIALIALPTAFATLNHGGEPIGFGLAVYERGWIGLFDIVIAADFRGRGHGRNLTAALLGWGGKVGASAAYLQVQADNQAAKGLYAQLGFEPAYAYHYRAPASLRRPGVK